MLLAKWLTVLNSKMKNMNMIKTIALIGALAAGSSAMAASITGTINFNAETGITLDTPGDFTTVDLITFQANPAASVGSLSSGSFAAIAPGTSVTFQNIDVGTAIPGLWSVGGFTFDLATSANLSTTSGLIISGTGTIKNAAFTDTPGTFSLTASASTPGQTVFSFQATSSAVPDGGATAMLLGAGLLGLGMIRRKVA
jgi:hypothetical protein